MQLRAVVKTDKFRTISNLAVTKNRMGLGDGDACLGRCDQGRDIRNARSGARREERFSALNEG